MAHPTTQKLRKIMQDKQTNLSLSIDLPTKVEILKMADLVGSEICVLKTHIDTVEDFDQEFTQKLQILARKHNFLIFEDRKFADMGDVARKQFSKSIYCINQWADIINAHGVTGPEIINGLKAAARPETGLLLVAQMSLKGNLLSPDLTNTIVSWADQNSDFVMGFIALGRLPTQNDFIVMTPGIHLEQTADGKDQQFLTPYQAIVERGSDVIIVGRGIYASNDPLSTAKRYREAGWKAYKLTN